MTPLTSFLCVSDHVGDIRHLRYRCFHAKYVVAIIAILALSVSSVSARNFYYRQGYHHVNRYGLHGLYRLSNSSHSFMCKMSTNYFAGDCERPGNLIIKRMGNGKGWTAMDGNAFSNNVGANISFYYCNRFNKMWAYRPQVSVGYIHGYCNFLRESIRVPGTFNQFERDFKSCILSYSMGVEFYPTDEFDFYLYTGIEGCTAFISRNFNGYLAETEPARNLHDKLTATTPVIPIGFGYKWLAQNYVLGFEIVWHAALIDTPKATMDGWPAEYQYNGFTYYPTKESTNKWSDSYLELGFCIGGLLGM